GEPGAGGGAGRVADSVRRLRAGLDLRDRLVELPAARMGAAVTRASKPSITWRRVAASMVMSVGFELCAGTGGTATARTTAARETIRLMAHPEVADHATRQHGRRPAPESSPCPSSSQGPRRTGSRHQAMLRGCRG